MAGGKVKLAEPEAKHGRGLPHRRANIANRVSRFNGHVWWLASGCAVCIKFPVTETTEQPAQAPVEAPATATADAPEPSAKETPAERRRGRWTRRTVVLVLIV